MQPPYSEGGSHHPNHACAVGAPSVSWGRPLSRMVYSLQSHPQKSFLYNFACMGHSFWTYPTHLMGPRRAHLAYREHLPNTGGCIIFARHCRQFKLMVSSPLIEFSQLTYFASHDELLRVFSKSVACRSTLVETVDRRVSSELVLPRGYGISPSTHRCTGTPRVMYKMYDAS